MYRSRFSITKERSYFEPKKTRKVGNVHWWIIKLLERLVHHYTHVSGTLGLYMMMTWPSYFIYAKAAILLEFKCPASSATSNSYMKSAIMMQLPQETQGNFSSNYLFPSYYTQTCKRKPHYHKENHQFTIRTWCYHECT